MLSFKRFTVHGHILQNISEKRLKCKKKKSFGGLNYQCMLTKKRKMEFQFDENLNGMRLNGNN